jgi:alanine racemase
MYRGTFAVVDLRALAHNVRTLKSSMSSKTKLLIAVKANAYGHGIHQVMKVFEQEDVAQVAVATLEEALTIRSLGYATPILILGALGPAELQVAAEHDIDVIYTDAWGPIEELKSFRETLKVHIPLDTGMNRVGFKQLDSAIVVIDQVLNRPDMHWQGLYTHLACSDSKSEDHAKAQIDQFSAWASQLEGMGYELPVLHAANSGAVLRHREWHMDMVRAGIAAYGYSPDEQVLPAPELRPVMHLYSSITRIAEVQPGETIGYGATYTADQKMRVATVGIGYADGYPRILSNRGCVLLRGQEVPVVGRVCMDQLMVDVTAVQDVGVGDFVTLFGDPVPTAWSADAWRTRPPQERAAWLIDTFAEAKTPLEGQALSLDRVADLAQTISYEILCQINARVPKLYIGR